MFDPSKKVNYKRNLKNPVDHYEKKIICYKWTSANNFEKYESEQEIENAISLKQWLEKKVSGPYPTTNRQLQSNIIDLSNKSFNKRMESYDELINKLSEANRQIQEARQAQQLAEQQAQQLAEQQAQQNNTQQNTQNNE